MIKVPIVLRKLKAFFRPRAVEVRILRRDPCRVTLREWRASKDMVKEAQIALAEPTVRRMTDVLRTESMTNWTLARDTPIEQRAIHQAQCEGYVLALNNLEAMGNYASDNELGEADFGAPEEELVTQ